MNTFEMYRELSQISSPNPYQGHYEAISEELETLRADNILKETVDGYTDDNGYKWNDDLVKKVRNVAELRITLANLRLNFNFSQTVHRCSLYWGMVVIMGSIAFPTPKIMTTALIIGSILLPILLCNKIYQYVAIRRLSKMEDRFWRVYSTMNSELAKIK